MALEYLGGLQSLAPQASIAFSTAVACRYRLVLALTEANAHNEPGPIRYSLKAIGLAVHCCEAILPNRAVKSARASSVLALSLCADVDALLSVRGSMSVLPGGQRPPGPAWLDERA